VTTYDLVKTFVVGFVLPRAARCRGARMAQPESKQISPSGSKALAVGIHPI
jgi:hypothetical protein